MEGQKLFRYRLKVYKKQKGRWLSHLDMQRLLIRACRRANLSLKHSEGFSPHPKITLTPALPVGIASYSEFVDLWLTQSLPIEKIVFLLNKNLPATILKVVSCQAVALNEPKLTSCLKEADYQVIVETMAEKSWDKFLSLLSAQVTIIKQIRRKRVIFIRCPLALSVKRVINEAIDELTVASNVRINRLHVISR